MGGNALLYARTGRKSADEYFPLMGKTMDKLFGLFPATPIASIQSVHGKETFGDGDILISTKNLPVDWIAQVWDAFQPNEMMINRTREGKSRASPLYFIRPEVEPGHPWMHDGTHYHIPREHIPCSAISFDHEGFQIDLIVTQPEDFNIAQIYYAYNDLGNLMGRIADRMGFKYGWSGLWKHIGEGNDIYATELVSRDPKEIFYFLGYDYERFKRGFITLENMFEFAASTPYFHRAPYQLENRNHKDRIRDEKRTSYTAFVEWIENKPWLDKYSWVAYKRNEVSKYREEEKASWLYCAMTVFSSFGDRYQVTQNRRAIEIEAKKVWNGEVVSTASGLTGRELGDFIGFCRQYKESMPHFYLTFDGWVSKRSPEEVKAFIAEAQRAFQK